MIGSLGLGAAACVFGGSGTSFALLADIHGVTGGDVCKASWSRKRAVVVVFVTDGLFGAAFSAFYLLGVRVEVPSWLALQTPKVPDSAVTTALGVVVGMVLGIVVTGRSQAPSKRMADLPMVGQLWPLLRVLTGFRRRAMRSLRRRAQRCRDLRRAIPDADLNRSYLRKLQDDPGGAEELPVQVEKYYEDTGEEWDSVLRVLITAWNHPDNLLNGKESAELLSSIAGRLIAKNIYRPLLNILDDGFR